MDVFVLMLFNYRVKLTVKIQPVGVLSGYTDGSAMVFRYFPAEEEPEAGAFSHPGVFITDAIELF